jgi:hypothetical protein
MQGQNQMPQFHQGLPMPMQPYDQQYGMPVMGMPAYP